MTSLNQSDALVSACRTYLLEPLEAGKPLLTEEVEGRYYDDLAFYDERNFLKR